MEIHRFLYKSDKAGHINVIAYILVFIALVAGVESILTSTILFFAAVVLFLFQRGIELDLRDGTYRFIMAVGPVYIGSWDKIPTLKTISVFSTNKVSTLTSRANNESEFKNRVIQVNLITERNQKIKILEVESKEPAFLLAKAVARKLEVNIWDATEREGSWVEL
jgi:ABC-type multidrug transport system fused ATPase/permease subunit